MSLIFIKCPDPFRINNNNIDTFAIGSFTWDSFAPAPEPLGAGIDSGANTEPITSIKYHTIEQVRFTSSVHAGDGDDGNRPLNFTNKCFSFLAEHVLWTINYILLPAVLTSINFIARSDSESILYLNPNGLLL